MKTKKKALLLAACAVMLVAVSVLGTLAYLQDKDSVTNTFTVGKVDLTLDEAKVGDNGQAVDPEVRVESNKYHLLPGHTYDKDPTVTIGADSEKSYVRIMMTVHKASAVQEIIKADDTTEGKGAVEDYADLFDGWKPTVWLYKGYDADADADTITFEFRYYKSANDTSGPNGDGVLEPLFTDIVVPGYVTEEQLKDLYGDITDGKEVADFKIELVAQAIQAAGFENDSATGKSAEDVAWEHFEDTVQQAE